MEKIFVLGAGTMGAGIVQAFAQKGYEVIVKTNSLQIIKAGVLVFGQGADQLLADHSCFVQICILVFAFAHSSKAVCGSV